MAQSLLFWEVLEAADQLTADEQVALLDILRKRLAAKGREQIVCEVQEARQDIAEGKCTVKTVDEIMKEILP